jgi:hypothetical protein
MDFEIDTQLAEILGIILGDGNIYSNEEKWQYQLDISLNPIDDPRYFLYVKHLLEMKFRTSPKICDVKGKAKSIRYYSKVLNNFLVDIGLIPGNKSVNQISIPKIMLQNDSLAPYVIKGLFDTDGSVSIDNDKDLRLTFSNCSKPLVQDFFNICRKIGIYPSPTIQFNKKRKAWRVMIAKKDEINKFLEQIRPEKFKEPNRRSWMALKVLFFRANEDDRIKIKSNISKWLKIKEKSLFTYSNDNLVFFKDLIENILRINLNTELINEIIREILELQKVMYNLENAKRFKFLYEKLRSNNRIVEYLIDQGEPNIPNRQTITKHLRRFFQDHQEDFNEWRSSNPKYRIIFDNNGCIRGFPLELRNIIISFIIPLLLGDKSDIYSKLKHEFSANNILIINWLLGSPKYGSSIQKYLLILINLCKELVYRSKNKISINITEISKNSNIPFNRKILTEIIDFINENQILNIKKIK